MRKIWIFSVLAILLCPTAAQADPYREPSLHPRDENAMIVRDQAFRRAVAFSVALDQYKAAIFAAVLEQVRYDEAQQARVAAAVERNRDNEDEITVYEPEVGSGRCGGNLPPCYIMERESGGDIHAENPNSTASGKWQFLTGTWDGYMGYPTAGSAPEWVQDQRAAEIWAGGAGCSHWSAC